MTRTAQNAFIEAELGAIAKIRDLTSQLNSCVEDFNRAESDLEEAKRILKLSNERADELAKRIRQYEERLHDMREQLRGMLTPPPLISLPVGDGRCMISNDEEIVCRQQ